MVGLEEREGFKKVKKKTAVFPVDMRSHPCYAWVCSLKKKKKKTESCKGLPVAEARAVNACTCPSSSWILSWVPEPSWGNPSPQHIGHCFSDIATPFIAGATSVVVRDVVVDITTWGLTPGSGLSGFNWFH